MFTKNFHPVGTSNRGTFILVATKSAAALRFEFLVLIYHLKASKIYNKRHLPGGHGAGNRLESPGKVGHRKMHVGGQDGEAVAVEGVSVGPQHTVMSDRNTYGRACSMDRDFQ
jgi:hypothetical protein